MSVRVSNDGEEWYEVSDEEFRTMLATLSVDGWVDLSNPTKSDIRMVTLDYIRKAARIDRKHAIKRNGSRNWNPNDRRGKQ